MQTDSEGKRHLNIGMTGLAILEGAFAVGLAYAGMHALHSAAR